MPRSRRRDAEHLLVHGFLGEDEPESVAETDLRVPIPRITLRLVVGNVETYADAVPEPSGPNSCLRSDCVRARTR